MTLPHIQYERAQPPGAQLSLDDLVARAAGLAASGSRRVLGISGSPGAGKSTLCDALVAALGHRVVLIGMDGFHLSNDELMRLGRRSRKGAPDTFDIEGYTALLIRLRSQTAETIYGPRFDRQLEESIGSAIPVPRSTSLVVTEGNYLLLESHGWDEVRKHLDEVWFLDVESEVRVNRLLARRASHGDSGDTAASWVREVDQANAKLVERSRLKADLVVRLTTTLATGRSASERCASPSSTGL